MNDVKLLIRYVESTLDVTYPIAPDALLDEATLERIFKYAVYTFGRKLQLEQVELRKMNLDPYTFHATGGELKDGEGQPQRASAFTGEFLISLKAEEQAKGLPALLQKKEEELERIHAQLVDLQYPGSEESSKKEAENQGSKGKQLRKGKKKQKGKGLEIVNEGLKSAQILQSDNQISKVKVPESEIEGLKSENEGLKSENDALKKRVDELEKEVKALKAEVKALKEEGKTLKEEGKTLKEEVKVQQEQIISLGEGQRLADKVRLRIALEAAHDKLVKDLGREPANESSWQDFIQTITPGERAGLGGKLSEKALALMGTGKKQLNRAVHSGFTIDIAIAITCVQQKQESWIEIFKYAYNLDPNEMVVSLKSEFEV